MTNTRSILYQTCYSRGKHLIIRKNEHPDYKLYFPQVCVSRVFRKPRQFFNTAGIAANSFQFIAVDPHDEPFAGCESLLRLVTPLPVLLTLANVSYKRA